MATPWAYNLHVPGSTAAGGIPCVHYFSFSAFFFDFVVTFYRIYRIENNINRNVAISITVFKKHVQVKAALRFHLERELVQFMELKFSKSLISSFSINLVVGSSSGYFFKF